MNDTLARELLAKTMDWNTEKLTQERKNLQLLAEYKYNEYQQFEPGMRFIESLAEWLGQFEEQSRELAYDFVKSKIIYVSAAELNHLIRMSYPDFIKRYLIDQIAPELNLKNHLVRKIIDDKRFDILKRQCLFLGLSDGARIDVLRRFAKLKHEQTYPTYSVTKEKADDLLCKLRHDLTQMTGTASNGKYRFVFLIDDFTASGLSYLRYKDKEAKGKIASFYREKRCGPLKKICDDGVKVCVVLYIATKKAKEHIKTTALTAGIKIDEVITVTELDDSVSMTEEDLGDFVRLAKEKLDECILTKHYKEGKHDKPYMGFDECGLSIVLNHNCPNNSLPIIWHESEDEKNIKALFPRSPRHQ